MATDRLLLVDELSVEYRSRHRQLLALDNVSLQIDRAETCAVVGETGSGKSTLGNAILGLVPIKNGTVTLLEIDVTHADWKLRREMSRHLQAVFQNPYGSLNPALTVGETLREPLVVHKLLNRSKAADRVGEVLSLVGLSPDCVDRYPRQFSGGQLQRIAIARALMISPKLIICDEPLSSLDLSVQAQIINLFRDLQDRLALSYLFIAHDIQVVRNLAHRVLVMYRGRVMETGPVSEVLERPVHPYTQALIAAVPTLNPAVQRQRRDIRLKQAAREHASRDKDQGCPFVLRCPFAMAVCSFERPALVQVDGGASVACHLAQDTPDAAAIPRQS
jgi:oligopeptide/dipeptide ABC transporter ATP-binding protein